MCLKNVFLRGFKQKYITLGKKEIYIVRHGQTDYNKIGKSQGRGVDAALNETGQAQARAFYNAYKDTGFEKLFLSTLRRTEESMVSFIDHGIPVEKLSGLDEISFGEREGRFFVEDGVDHYQLITDKWRSGQFDYKFDQGESPLDVVKRQKEAVSYILGQAQQKVLICMHGRAMRILLTWLLGYDLSQMDRFKHSNLGLYVLQYNDSNFSLTKENETSHLSSSSIF